MKKINLENERKKLDREITFFHLKKAKERIFRCLEFAKEKKDDFFFFYFLAQYFIIVEDFKKALDYLNIALNIRKNDPCTYNDKAICLAELGKYKEALDCFNEGILKNRDYPLLYHNKGWLLNLLNRHKEAILCFKKALEIEPDLPEALWSLADSYLKLKDKINAKKYLKKALLNIKGKSSFIYKLIKKELNKLD